MIPSLDPPSSSPSLSSVNSPQTFDTQDLALVLIDAAGELPIEDEDTFREERATRVLENHHNRHVQMRLREELEQLEQRNNAGTQTRLFPELSTIDNSISLNPSERALDVNSSLEVNTQISPLEGSSQSHQVRDDPQQLQTVSELPESTITSGVYHSALSAISPTNSSATPRNIPLANPPQVPPHLSNGQSDSWNHSNESSIPDEIFRMDDVFRDFSIHDQELEEIHSPPYPHDRDHYEAVFTPRGRLRERVQRTQSLRSLPPSSRVQRLEDALIRFRPSADNTTNEAILLGQHAFQQRLEAIDTQNPVQTVSPISSLSLNDPVHHVTPNIDSLQSEDSLTSPGSVSTPIESPLTSVSRPNEFNSTRDQTLQNTDQNTLVVGETGTKSNARTIGSSPVSSDFRDERLSQTQNSQIVHHLSTASLLDHLDGFVPLTIENNNSRTAAQNNNNTINSGQEGLSMIERSRSLGIQAIFTERTTNSDNVVLKLERSLSEPPIPITEQMPPQGNMDYHQRSPDNAEPRTTSANVLENKDLGGNGGNSDDTDGNCFNKTLKNFTGYWSC